ncbi:hypothetical protein BDQ12DRAFT_739694, partial [Crucibulum laeve]
MGQSSSSFFKNASDITIIGSTMIAVSGNMYYIAKESITKNKNQSKEDDISNEHNRECELDTIPERRLELKKELLYTSQYRIYSANHSESRRSNRAVIVKVFQGFDSRERHAKEIGIMRKLFHPNIARLRGVSPSCHLEDPYVVYQGVRSNQCSVHVYIANELGKDLNQGLNSSLRFAKGAAAGIDYLENKGIPLQHLAVEGSFQNLDILLGMDGEVVLAFSLTVSENSSPDHSSGNGWSLFNAVCRKTLADVNSSLYGDSPERADTSFYSQTAHPTSHRTTNGNTPNQALASSNSSSFPRREVHWEVDESISHSLVEITRSYQDHIDLRSSLRRIDVSESTSRLHQCPDYLREEITLCPDLKHSFILAHTAPAPKERCIICGELVLSPIVKPTVKPLKGQLRSQPEIQPKSQPESQLEIQPKSQPESQ